MCIKTPSIFCYRHNPTERGKARRECDPPPFAVSSSANVIPLFCPSSSCKPAFAKSHSHGQHEIRRMRTSCAVVTAAVGLGLPAASGFVGFVAPTASAVRVSAFSSSVTQHSIIRLQGDVDRYVCDSCVCLGPVRRVYVVGGVLLISLRFLYAFYRFACSCIYKHVLLCTRGCRSRHRAMSEHRRFTCVSQKPHEQGSTWSA